MHIAVLSEHFHKRVSGPTRAFLHMAHEFSAMGHELTLIGISRTRGRETIPGGQAILYKYSWKIIPVKYGRPRYYAHKLMRVHRQRPIDVVWAMGLESGAAAVKFRERADVPFVLNPRSFIKDKTGEWKFERAKTLIRECDAFVALTDNAADRWCAKLEVERDDRIFGVINGVRADELEGDTEKPGGVGDEPIILSMGMLRGPKGHHFVIRALARHCRDLPWQLVIAGDGPWKDRLSDYAREENIADRVRFVGLVQGAKWRWLYRNARVFALYSVYPEACGNAFLEAQAAGLPIVTSDQGSLPEVVPHDEAGLICKREPNETELERLGGTLRRVLEDEELRARLGQSGRERALKLTWRQCAEGYLEAFKRAMK